MQAYNHLFHIIIYFIKLRRSFSCFSAIKCKSNWEPTKNQNAIETFVETVEKISK